MPPNEYIAAARRGEELKQLLKMYKEDDLTEETEEIILKRQRYAVESAEFRLKSAKLATKRSLEVTIPRSAIDQEQALKNAEVLWKTARETLPSTLQQKRLEIKKLQVEDKRADEKSAELKADRALMDVPASSNGRIYHGEIRKGRWNPAAAAKFMKVGGKIPPRIIFASLIPDDAVMQLDAFVDEASVTKLKSGHKGYVTPISSPRSRLSVEISKISSHPAVDGKYHVVLKVSARPDGLHLVPGMKGKAKITTGDEGDRLACLHGIDAGLPAFGDCTHNFLEVLLVSLEVDGLGIVSPEACFGSLHHALVNLGIPGGLIHEIPDLEGFVSEEDAATVSAELDTGRVTVF